MIRNAMWLSVGLVAAGTLLSGCDDNHHNRSGMMAGTQISVPELAVDQVARRTCDDVEPDEINTVQFRDSDALVQVATLTPGCAY
ncbi:hypothetical protein [Solimonas marina]|uniref:Uncharacterized protein n=1 Tax=Solimonas marina TaxID=2714601 RepID=A0A969W863_9GAMM|nr:hypothetical protein [Solimonas marina]NKF21258.1 hypothetical protein [Solimonas marina]